MGKYRVTFSGRGKSTHIDVIADSFESAMDMAYDHADRKRLREKGYSDICVGEIPKGASVIGIEFEYYDKVFKRTFHEHMFIRADNERQASDYYEEHLYGKRFGGQGHIGSVDENGKCTYGKVCETYFACGGGYQIDISKSA